ncbi:MAG: hypothetical protein RI564_09755, partial [Gracilimonas sp.]|nr:hypothetical protein [Gracilimonas sp.]
MIQRLSTSIIFLVFALFIYSCDLSSVEDKSEAPFPCVNGSANGYACENVDLFSQVSIYDLSGDSTDVSLNDIWGWTDPQTGKEYALVGLTNGTSFVDISDPANPVVVGRLPQSNLSEKFKQLTIDNYPACNLGIGA